MNITQHSNTLTQLTKMLAFNCYFVHEETTLTLIDASLPNSAEAILQAAEGIGLPITRVLLTHAHADHVGSLDELRQRLPDAEFAFTARTESFLHSEPQLLSDEPQAPIKGGFITSTVRADTYLNDGDVIGSLRIIAAPGHSPDHVAFWDERTNILIAGDAFQTAGGTSVSGSLRVLFPFPAFATWHKPTALETAQKLLNLGPVWLAVGHGPVLRSPQQKMIAAIDRAS